MKGRSRAVNRLYQQVAQRIAQAIAEGSYPAGAPLPPERELAATYECSRLTIREAIITLVAEGWIDTCTRGGVTRRQKLTKPAKAIGSAGEVELVEARLAVEGDVAALAARQISHSELAALDRLIDAMAGTGDEVAVDGRDDRRFHEMVAHASGNATLAGIVARLCDISPSSGGATDPGEYRAIVAALRKRDADSARAAMRRHLSRRLGRLLDAAEHDAIAEAREQVAAQRSRFRAAVSARADMQESRP